MPAIACFMNAVATNVLMKRGLWKIVLYATLIYSILQFILIKVAGYQPMYFFINFEDGARTYIVLTLITMVTCMLYFVLCIIDEKTKPGKIKKE